MAQTGPRDKATIEALKERMARDPLSRAFLQLAEEYRKAGRFEEAVQVCNEGLARHPGYHTARIALGRTYLDAGDLESAHQALTEVLDTMPENHLAAKLLAEVQLRLGNRAGAAETYRAILSHYPGDREVEGLLHELGEEGRSVGGPADDFHPPTAGGEVSAAATIPAAAAGGLPPPLEVVDGGDPPAVPLPAHDGALAAAAPAHEPPPPSPVPIDETGPTRPAEADALHTNTLAELYLRQGLVDRALEVYRAMLRVDPGNERARRRLEDLSGEGASIAGEEPAATEEAIPGATAIGQRDPGHQATPAVSVVVDDAAPPGPPGSDPDDSRVSAPAVAMSGDEPHPLASPGPVTRPAAATIERLERWLVTIRSDSRPAGRESRR